jgi:hypothetical protein
MSPEKVLAHLMRLGLPLQSAIVENDGGENAIVLPLCCQSPTALHCNAMQSNPA